MGHHLQSLIASVVALCCAMPVATAASAAPDAGGVTQPAPHGQIDWTAKTVSVSGVGAPSLKAANVSAARAGAERTAKADAYHNLLDTVRTIRLSGGQTVGTMLDAAAPAKSRVEEVCKDFRVSDTRYFADGGVDIGAQFSLDGPLIEALLPPTDAPAVSLDPNGEHTGVIFNAKGLSLTPSLTVRIVDDTGAMVYAAEQVTKEARRQHGVVSYTRSLEQASKDTRVADKPIVVRAAKPKDASQADLQIAAADATLLRSFKNVLALGRVIIVVD